MGYLATTGVGNTEKEIFAYGSGDIEPEQVPGYVMGDEDDQNDDPEAVEGWDGNPLGDDEIAETSIRGYPDNGHDRPLQLARDQDHSRAIAQRDEFIADQQQEIANLKMQADPMRQQRMAALREDLELRVASNLGQHVDYTLGLEQQRNQLLQERHATNVNYSLNMAKQQYGEHFDRAYATLTRMNPADPRAQAQVRAIWDAPDPGDALMRWYSGAAARPLSGGARRGIMPSLNSGSAGTGDYRGSTGGRSASRRDDDFPDDSDMDIGGFDPGVERDIMAYATR